MDKRVALITLWAAFAVAAVGVGFGAAGLVGGPFSDGVTDAAVVGQIQQPAGTSPAESPGSSSSATSSASSSPTATTGRGPAATGKPSRSARTSAPSASGPSASGPSAPRVPVRSVTRSITTSGGLVSATCRSGRVQVSGSPAVGWEIEDIDVEDQRDARVRFERPDADGRVEVAAACSGGAPRFSLDDRSGDEDDGGGDGGGDGDSSSVGGGSDGDEDRD